MLDVSDANVNKKTNLLLIDGKLSFLDQDSWLMTFYENEIREDSITARKIITLAVWDIINVRTFLISDQCSLRNARFEFI